MFCHRIGREFGIIDIDLIDDSLTEEQLLEFQAVAFIDGWYHGRTSDATIVAEIRNLGNRLIASQAAKPKEAFESMTWANTHDVIDQMTTTKRKKSKTMLSAHEAQQEAARRYG